MRRDRTRSPLWDCEPEALQTHCGVVPRLDPLVERIVGSGGRIPRRSFCLMSLAAVSLFFSGRPRSVPPAGLSRRPAMYVRKE
jgi:hypothetical protein